MTAKGPSPRAGEGSDEALMQSTREGNLLAFEMLVERYRDRMLNYVARSLVNPASAEDLFQELFIRVYEARWTYRPTAKFSTWLYTIAHNLCLNENRNRRTRDQRSVSLEDRIGSPDGADSGLKVQDLIQGSETDPLNKINDQEREARIKQAVSELPEEYRDFLILKHFEEMDYDDIAAIAGISRDAVKMRAVRARRALKTKLQAMEGE